MPARSLGKFSHSGDVGPAQPVLHGTSTGRADLQQFDEGIRSRKGLLQIGFELGLHAVARGNAAFGNHDHLAEPRVRGLQVERQHKSRSAGSYISRPMLDSGIALQLLTLEACDLRVRLRDRGVLRQVPVDDQFGAVRRREKLLLHEVHAEQSERKCRDRYPNGDPAMPHADQKQRWRTSAQPGLCTRDDFLILAGRIVTPSNGVNSTATIQDTSNETAMTTNRVKVNSPALLVLRPIGMKPATVTSVPVSIGKAVDV